MLQQKWLEETAIRENLRIEITFHFDGLIGKVSKMRKGEVQ
jgi:hypothetical protein